VDSINKEKGGVCVEDAQHQGYLSIESKIFQTMTPFNAWILPPVTVPFQESPCLAVPWL
jgi:hypothetical protein